MELADFGPDRLTALVGTDRRVSLCVMAVEGVKKTWWIADDGANRVARLEAALKSGVVTGSPQAFPGGATDHADLTFWARKQVIQGPGLRAVRSVGTYDQTNSTLVNSIQYAIDGMTPDGRYFVMIRGWVSHPAIHNKESNLEGDKLTELRAQVARKLDAAPASSFVPDLTKLDEWVRSFAIR